MIWPKIRVKCMWDSASDFESCLFVVFWKGDIILEAMIQQWLAARCGQWWTEKCLSPIIMPANMVKDSCCILKQWVCPSQNVFKTFIIFPILKNSWSSGKVYFCALLTILLYEMEILETNNTNNMYNVCCFPSRNCISAVLLPLLS